MKQVKKQTKTASKKRRSAQKQTPKISVSNESADASLNVRFSATIHLRQAADPDALNKLDIDRIPDPKGLIRALLTPADCVRLLDQGFEVRLEQAYPVQPLDPKLIESDDSFKRWLDKSVQTIKGARKRK